MIAFCHLLNDSSGSPVVLRDAIRALTSDGKPGILFVGSQGRGALESVNTPIRRYWYRRSHFRLITLFNYLISQGFLYRSLAEAKLPANTIVYVNTLLPFGAALWARRNQCRVLYHIHESSVAPYLLQRILSFILRKCTDCVIYVSQDNQARMPLPGVRSVVISNPVALQISCRGRATPYNSRRSGKFSVLMIASPRDFKGVPEFLALARGLVARRDLQFILLLNGSSKEIGKYLPEGSVPDNVEVHPRTNSPENFYAEADILLNLSRVDRVVETFGMTIVEGMAFGLPVIAPPVGGPTEIITHGLEGYLIDSRDHNQLKRTVLSLADSPEHAKEMSTAARRRADDFSVSSFAEALHAQLDLLTSNNQSEED